MVAASLACLGYIGFVERTRADQKPTRPPLEYKVPLHAISLVGADLVGSNEAPVTLLVYSDFICPACRRFAIERLPRIQKRYVEPGRVRIGIRHLPGAKLHSLAPRAAEAAVCAAEQGGFWHIYDSIFRAQLSKEYGRLELASFEQDLPTFVTNAGLDLSRFQACLASDRPADRVYRDAGSAVALGVESTPSILVGEVVEGDRVRVSRHFRGLPSDEILDAALDSVLAPHVAAVGRPGDRQSRGGKSRPTGEGGRR
jgi:protein-disulfide isomerase